LKPNREQRNQSNVKAIPGISNWFEWSWLTEGPLAGYVCARDLPDFGEKMTFSMSKFTKTELVQPKPTVGGHSEVSSKWTMPIYRASGKLIISMAFLSFLKNHVYCMISFCQFCLAVSNTDRWDVRRWSIDKLRDELNRRNIHFDINIGRDELVNILKREIGEETQIDEELREDFSKTNIDE
jgi:hypothetical protein